MMRFQLILIQIGESVNSRHSTAKKWLYKYLVVIINSWLLLQLRGVYMATNSLLLIKSVVSIMVCVSCSCSSSQLYPLWSVFLLATHQVSCIHYGLFQVTGELIFSGLGLPLMVTFLFYWAKIDKDEQRKEAVNGELTLFVYINAYYAQFKGFKIRCFVGLSKLPLSRQFPGCKSCCTVFFSFPSTSVHAATPV